MLLKSTFSSTKKFFKNTIRSFKSLLLSGGYERLPKTPSFNPFSCSGIEHSKAAPSFRELEKFYVDFSNRWDFEGENAGKKGTKKKEKENPKKDDQEVYKGNCINFEKQSNLETGGQNEKKQRSLDAEERSAAYKVKEERSYLVMKRLKELELMDVSNVDHVLDIEEVLHYYSRLTCPAYLEIVDRFFVQMRSEFFNSSTISVVA